MFARRPLLALTPFWIFIFLFKAAGSLHYTLFPILSEHVFPVWVTGLLVGGAAALQMILDVPAGYCLDRWGYIRTLKGSTLFFVLAGGCLLFGISKITLLGSLFLAMVGWLFFGPGMNAYLLSQAESNLAGRFMGARDTIASAGVVGGMILLPYLIHRSTTTMSLVLAGGFTCAIIALFYSHLDAASVHTSKKISHQSFYIRRHFIHHVLRAIVKLNPVSTALLLQQFCAAAFYGIVWFVIPLMIQQMAHPGVLSFGLVVFDSAVLFTGFALGKLTDTWNKRWLIFWGLLGFSLFALLLGFHFNILFALFGFLATTGDEMASVSLWAWLDHLDKNHAEDGLITGILTLSEDLGWTVGPIIAGICFVPLGPTWTIAIGAGLIFIAWSLSTILLSRSKISHFAHLIAHLRHQDLVPHRTPHKR